LLELPRLAAPPCVGCPPGMVGGAIATPEALPKQKQTRRVAHFRNESVVMLMIGSGDEAKVKVEKKTNMALVWW